MLTDILNVDCSTGCEQARIRSLEKEISKSTTSLVCGDATSHVILCDSVGPMISVTATYAKLASVGSGYSLLETENGLFLCLWTAFHDTMLYATCL